MVGCARSAPLIKSSRERVVDEGDDKFAVGAFSRWVLCVA